MQIKELLGNLTGHNNIFLKARGNYAIRDSLRLLNPEKKEKKILVQDQGGWLRYLDYPTKYGYVVEKIKTDNSVIEVKELEEMSKEADVVIYEDPGGYFAQQPIKEIYEICRKNNCRVILDITGSVGWQSKPGYYADIIVCSFGKGKPVDLGYGGLLSISGGLSLPSLPEEDFDDSYSTTLMKKLPWLEERQQKMREKSNKIKNELKDFKVLHPEKDGINVVVAFDSVEEKEKILSYCANNNLDYTVCPRYIRVLRDAISIEVKRDSTVG